MCAYLPEFHEHPDDTTMLNVLLSCADSPDAGIGEEKIVHAGAGLYVQLWRSAKRDDV